VTLKLVGLSIVNKTAARPKLVRETCYTGGDEKAKVAKPKLERKWLEALEK